MKISLVIPVYNSANTIEALVFDLHKELSSSFEIEVVLVDDASSDGSAEKCFNIAKGHAWVRFIQLSRNFGEHNAVMAGLNQCQGDVAVILDDDFQNPPAEVIKLVKALDDDLDVVYSFYSDKRHSFFRNLGSRFTNGVANLMLEKPKSLYLSSFKAINRFTIDQIIKYQGPFPYIDGLIFRVTGRYGRVLVDHHASRRSGGSGYTFGKLISLWMNMFMNFSILPLRISSFAGLLFSVVGLLGALVFFIERMRDPNLPLGWASLIISLFIISGVQLFALGMMGEYLGRLFLKDSGKPQFTIRRTVNCGESSDDVE